jgi:hypothetical protein
LVMAERIKGTIHIYLCGKPSPKPPHSLSASERAILSKNLG